ncbi:MAG: hypothetical protein ACLU0O_08030 [Collinsella sp.]
MRDGKMIVRLRGVETLSSSPRPSSRSRAITMSSMPYVPPRLLWPSVPIPRALPRFASFQPLEHRVEPVADRWRALRQRFQGNQHRCSRKGSDGVSPMTA